MRRKVLRFLKKRFPQAVPLSARGLRVPGLATALVAESEWLLLKNDGISQHLIRGEEWEPHFGKLVRLLVRPGDDVLDIGANFGFHTVTLAKQVGPAGRVLAFEPLRLIFQQLCANVFINRLGNIYPYNRAVARQSGDFVEMNPVNFDADWVNVGDTRVGRGGDHVETIAIDSLQLKRVAFIKIDVQGYELLALEGARETLERCRPVMFIEIEERHLKACGTSSRELMEYVLQRGYRMFRIMTDYPCDHLAVPLETKVSPAKLQDALGCEVQAIEGPRLDVVFSEKYEGATYDHCVAR